MTRPVPSFRLLRSKIAVATLLASCAAAPALASGDGFMENDFAPEFHVPSAELLTYAAGKPGIVPASFWRVYHVLAYRAMSGAPLSKAEMDLFVISNWAALPAAKDPGKKEYDQLQAESAASINKWLATRKLAGKVADIKIDTYKGRQEYFSFLNCPDDAFERASSTLQERLKSGGAQWAAVWRSNQDAVFANCDDEPDPKTQKRVTSLPAPVPANAPAWLKLDHEYQMAAALFYAQQFDQARVRFLQIAKNTASPWQPLGAYLASRSLIRKATLESPALEVAKAADLQKRNALLQTARNELLAQNTPAAQRLIGWLDARLRPQERAQELARMIASGRFDAKSVTALGDYLLVLDMISRSDMLKANEPMNNWIGAMQADISRDDAKDAAPTHKDAIALMRKHWQSKRDPLWLVPLLTLAKPGEAQPDELKAAASVSPSSPTFHTLQYHLARLALAQGKSEQADAIVSDVLAKQGNDLSPSNRNRWLRIKFLATKNFTEFLQAANRKQVENLPPEPKPGEKKTEGDTPPEQPRTTDCDFANQVLRHLPLAQLKQIHRNGNKLPNLADLIWTRAVLLEDWASADEYTELIAQGRATTKHLYPRFLQAKTPLAKRQAAAVIFVNLPELKAYGHEDRTFAWQCESGFSQYETPELNALSPAFLSQQERDLVPKEQKKFKAYPYRSSYLGPILLEWAKAYPDDPEVPKALHLFVAGTRLEHQDWSDIKTNPRPHYSREVYLLLHKRYPKSEWTAKTKYFY